MAMTYLGKAIRRSGPNVAVKKQDSEWSWGWNAFRAGTRSPITDKGALSQTAFWRGLMLISGTLASLPLHIYDEDDKGVMTKTKTPETSYLWLRPNVEMTRQVLWQHVIADMVLGNAFIFVQKTKDGQIDSLWWIHRKRVKVGRTSDGLKVYQVDNERPMIDYAQGGEIVHLRGYGDGLVGYDLIDLAQGVLSLSESAQDFALSSLESGQIPPGLITTEQSLTREQADALVKLWRSQHAGIANSQDVGFLGNGAKFQQLSIDHDRMQMESLRRFQVHEVARLFGLPPFLLSDVTGSSQGGGQGLEEQNRALIVFSQQAHISNVEQTIEDILLVRELTGRRCKLDLRGLLRGSTLQRYQAYAMGYGRWLTAEDIRDLEDMPHVDGAELLLAAMNLVPAEQLGKVGGQE